MYYGLGISVIGKILALFGCALLILKLKDWAKEDASWTGSYLSKSRCLFADFIYYELIKFPFINYYY